MRKMAIGLLLGSMSALFITEPPSVIQSGSILLVSVFFPIYFRTRYKSIPSFVSVTLAACCLTLMLAELQRQHAFPAQYEGKDLLVVGKVDSLVDHLDHGLSFGFAVTSARLAETSQALDWRGRIRLNAYRNLPDIAPGERWQLQIRLKRSNGLMNPGGFDYEKWLFAKRIDAKGYLRKSSLQQQLNDAPWYSVNAWRASIRDRISRLAEQPEHSAVFRALMIADKQAVTDAQWDTFRDTGTSHLMAISGLHIGLIAAFGWVLVSVIWWCFPSLCLWMPAKHAGAVVGVVLATFYALLAGLSIPTQRALVMVVVALILLASKRHFSASRVLALAVIAVLLMDPLAVLSVGFFLSFSAVLIILWILSREVDAQRYRLLRLQGYLSLLMLPIGFVFFGEGSLVSPVANLIAIPWVSLIIVPFSFLALLMSYLHEGLAIWAFQFVSFHLDGLNTLLETLSALPKASMDKHYLPSLLSLLLVVIACLLIMPSGIRWRYSAVLALLPLVFYKAPWPQRDQTFWLTVLDVGQGLSVVVQTRDKTLVYDTGDRPSENYDLGKMVLVPYLKQQGITSIDTLVISHNDRDHSGGAKSLLDEVAVDEIYSSDLLVLPDSPVRMCERGQVWTWGKVRFEFLHPSLNTHGNDNNRSCVLKVSNSHHSVLLSGDIQKQTERVLVKEQPEQLASDILLMPHHGSNSSSTMPFIRAVNPDWVVASAAYRSRFRHPDQRVLKRYQAAGINVLDTATEGAIQFRLSEQGGAIQPIRHRREVSGFWSRQLP